VNVGKTAWENNYVILDTKGRGHYLGCNLSVTNFQGTWWGEGDDMIWVDGFKWPPDLHGTGARLPQSGLGHAAKCVHAERVINLGGAHERLPDELRLPYRKPVRFDREIKVTIEHGHANHLANEMSSVAYWYAASLRERSPCPRRKAHAVLRTPRGTGSTTGATRSRDERRRPRRDEGSQAKMEARHK